MKKLMKNRKGFTLIELIVVIAILGILAAVLIPQFTGFQQKAREKATLSEAKTIATAIDAYYAENSSYPSGLSDLSSYIAITGLGTLTMDADDDGGFTYTMVGDTSVAGRASASAKLVCPYTPAS